MAQLFTFLYKGAIALPCANIRTPVMPLMALRTFKI